MWLVGQKGPNWAFLVLAAVLIVYSGLGLLRIRLHIHADLEKLLAPVIGVVSGFVAGLVGVPIIPLMPYLQGLDIKPSELVQSLGVVLCATSLTLTVSLLNFGLLDGPRAIVSAAAVVPALAGMWVGQQIRLRLSVEQFRLAVFWALLLTGALYFRQPPVVIVCTGMLHGKRILLIVAGGIAAFKSLELIRRLRERGAAVRCVLTAAGAKFVTPLSLQALSEDRVYTDMFSLTDENEMGHIQLSRDADLLVVAPATANILARMAGGLADDLAATVLLATDKPVLAAPAMNVRMWTHAATVANVETLKKRGVTFVGPNDGAMACNEHGPGRMSEPEEIVAAIEQMLAANRPLAGQARAGDVAVRRARRSIRCATSPTIPPASRAMRSPPPSRGWAPRSRW